MKKALLFAALLAVSSMEAQAATPVAKLKSANVTAGLPEPAPLDGSPSTCDNGCEFSWNFGDNTPSSPDSFVLHQYAAAGSYTVTLKVKDKVTGQTSTTTGLVKVAVGKTLNGYVTACKQQLGFTDADVAAVAGNLNCAKATAFAPNDRNQFTPINDYMGYARVTNDVDLVFACRWLDSRPLDRVNTNPFKPPFVQAASVELLMHNRQNGNTCFFQAKERPISGPDGRMESGVPVAIVSPTVAAAAAPNTPEAKFWASPPEMERTLACVDCHVTGPYIATPRIAPVLTQFGLLNNGHDTLGLTFDAQNNPVGRYHAVASTLDNFNTMLATNNGSDGCTNACHGVAYGSQAETVFHNVINSDVAKTLLPAIAEVIDSGFTGATDISVRTSGAMTPFNDASHYRWINLDTPIDSVETENFADAKSPAAANPVPKLLAYCAAPTALEAHAVGIPNNLSFTTDAQSKIPDRLRSFNLKDGLVCMNSDQEAGQSCHDYAVHYLCSVNTGDGTPTWSDWYNTDSPSNDGDHEERSRHQNICGGATPIAMEAAMVTSGGGKAIYAMGPNDRLSRFSPYGLACKTSEQPDGKCSNYVVRYSACTTAPAAVSRTLTNVFAAGKQVTAATGSLVKGQAHNGGWNTQNLGDRAGDQYRIRRLKNTSTTNNVTTTVYLNVQSDGTTVGTAALNNTATSEMWTVSRYPAAITSA